MLNRSKKIKNNVLNILLYTITFVTYINQKIEKKNKSIFF